MTSISCRRNLWASPGIGNVARVWFSKSTGQRHGTPWVCLRAEECLWHTGQTWPEMLVFGTSFLLLAVICHPLHPRRNDPKCVSEYHKWWSLRILTNQKMLFWGPKHPCYTGSNPSIGGSQGFLVIFSCFIDRCLWLRPAVTAGSGQWGWCSYTTRGMWSMWESGFVTSGSFCFAGWLMAIWLVELDILQIKCTHLLAASGVVFRGPFFFVSMFFSEHFQTSAFIVFI